MRDYTDVAVEQAVVHIVNPRAGALRISEMDVDLSEPVRDFLRTYVVRGLGDNSARAAQFVILGDDRASGVCAALLTDATKFIDSAGRLASILYDASKDDDRIADGALVVLRCVSAVEPFLALLKLEPSDAYRAIEERDARGTLRIRLEVEPNILPSVRERLQKAAFIRATSGDGLHMLLVDRQRAGTTVSRFFTQDFLGAELKFDDRERTRTLYSELKSARNEIAPRLTEVQLKQLDQYIDGQMVGQHVNVDELVASLPVPVEDRPYFSERLDRELPDRDFDLDQETVRGYLKSRTYIGDNGLLVRVPTEFAEMVKASPPAAGDDRWTVTIRTQKWTQK